MHNGIEYKLAIQKGEMGGYSEKLLNKYKTRTQHGTYKSHSSTFSIKVLG